MRASIYHLKNLEKENCYISIVNDVDGDDGVAVIIIASNQNDPISL